MNLVLDNLALPVRIRPDVPMTDEELMRFSSVNGNLRWEALTEKQQSGYAPLCPEFVIELRSPSEKLPDLKAMMELWMANGAQVGWLIDPIKKEVVIYRAGQAAEMLTNPTTVQGNGPIAGFELVMARTWS